MTNKYNENNNQYYGVQKLHKYINDKNRYQLKQRLFKFKFKKCVYKIEPRIKGESFYDTVFRLIRGEPLEVDEMLTLNKYMVKKEKCWDKTFNSIRKLFWRVIIPLMIGIIILWLTYFFFY